MNDALSVVKKATNLALWAMSMDATAIGVAFRLTDGPDIKMSEQSPFSQSEVGVGQRKQSTMNPNNGHNEHEKGIELSL